MMCFREVRPETCERVADEIVGWLGDNGNEFGVRSGKIQEAIGTSKQLLVKAARGDGRTDYIKLSGDRSRIRLRRAEVGW